MHNHKSAVKSGWDGEQYFYEFSCGCVTYSSDGKLAPIV